jgi:hypothetical protein
MDADDIMHFQRLEKQILFLKNNPTVDIVGSSYYAINSSNAILGFRKGNLVPKSINDILKNGCFAHPSVMGKLSWFQNNKYDGNWERMEDLELWIRTFSFSKFRNIQEPLLFYRVFGIPILAKYIKSNLGIIKLLRKRKEYSISLYDSYYFSGSFLFKIIIYSFLDFFGKMDFILKNRFNVITEEQSMVIKRDLSKSIQRNII